MNDVEENFENLGYDIIRLDMDQFDSLPVTVRHEIANADFSLHLTPRTYELLRTLPLEVSLKEIRRALLVGAETCRKKLEASTYDDGCVDQLALDKGLI